MTYVVLKESEKEKGLKEYFQHMEHVYGEEVAVETAIELPNIKDSLSGFTDRFDSYSDNDIYSAILRTSILSKESNEHVRYANSLIAKGQIDELIMSMQVRPEITRDLVQNFVRYSYTTPRELYYKRRKRKSSESIIHSLEKINSYFSEADRIKEKENISKKKIPVTIAK